MRSWTRAGLAIPVVQNRRWSETEKPRFVAESYQPEFSAALVARRKDGVVVEERAKAYNGPIDTRETDGHTSSRSALGRSNHKRTGRVAGRDFAFSIPIGGRSPVA